MAQTVMVCWKIQFFVNPLDQIIAFTIKKFVLDTIIAPAKPEEAP